MQILREAGEPASFARRANDDRFGRIQALDGAEFPDQDFVAAVLVERIAPGFRLSGAAAPEFAVAILCVLGQFFDNLRLAGGREVQAHELLANLFVPIRHFRLR